MYKDRTEYKEDTVKAKRGSSILWSDFPTEVLRQPNVSPWNCNEFMDRLELVNQEAHNNAAAIEVRSQRGGMTCPHPEDSKNAPKLIQDTQGSPGPISVIALVF